MNLKIDTNALHTIAAAAKYREGRSPEQLTTGDFAAQLDFGDRESYLAWATEWKAFYAELSSVIRAAKREIKSKARGGEDTSAQQSQLSRQRYTARLLCVLRRASKIQAGLLREQYRLGLLNAANPAGCAGGGWGVRSIVSRRDQYQDFVVKWRGHRWHPIKCGRCGMLGCSDECAECRFLEHEHSKAPENPTDDTVTPELNLEWLTEAFEETLDEWFYRPPGSEAIMNSEKAVDLIAAEYAYLAAGGAESKPAQTEQNDK